ncbi:MAG TPA: glycerol-3-phosphate 1-O-acyltransferase PlsY [Candidatus Omnitrophota bacterium]|nr:glycerol-3-phosphate 1-O-acyltransferase PlsY [Candidatus Omnitrophota bacterium]
MPWIILGIITSYLLGSIPTAYIFGRIKGIDIRKSGSGNIGATNALRVLGKKVGITVLLLDVLKGSAAVIFLGNFALLKAVPISLESLLIALGLSCICGHIWTVFLRFKGGKGVATTLGVLLGLAIKLPALKIALGLVLLIWLLAFILFRIVSLASMISILALPILMLALKQSGTLIFSSLILSLLVILRHKSNLKRLFEGKESRLKF